MKSFVNHVQVPKLYAKGKVNLLRYFKCGVCVCVTKSDYSVATKWSIRSVIAIGPGQTG